MWQLRRLPLPVVFDDLLCVGGVEERGENGTLRHSRRERPYAWGPQVLRSGLVENTEAKEDDLVGTLFLQTFNLRLRIWTFSDGHWGALEGAEEGQGFRKAEATGGSGQQQQEDRDPGSR